MNQSSRINLFRWNVNIVVPRANLKHLPRFHEKRFNGIIRHDGQSRHFKTVSFNAGAKTKNLVEAKQTIVRCHAFRPLLELYFLKTISFFFVTG